MVRKVVVNFNMMVDPSMRADQHPSFQYYVTTLGDVPVVGDYVGMLTWNQAEKRFSRRMVKVTGRRVVVSEPRDDDRYEPEDELTIFVTLMVEATSKADGMPDFRG